MTKLWRVQCTVNNSDSATIEDALFPLSVAMEESPGRDGQTHLTFLVQSKPQTELLENLPASINITEIKDQDWLAQTARGATQAGSFTLLPLGETVQDAANTILIDGRYAFGDGHHPTTIGCIEAMERLKAARISPERIADIGCGTGILALAAAKLWPEAEVIASDCEAAAVAATQAAASANQLDLQVFEASGFEARNVIYDLIVMNLLLGPLLALAAEAAAYLTRGGCCILSGILPEQTEAVAAAYAAQGLGELPRSQHDGWMTLMFKRL